MKAKYKKQVKHTTQTKRKQKKTKSFRTMSNKWKLKTIKTVRLNNNHGYQNYSMIGKRRKNKSNYYCLLQTYMLQSSAFLKD